MKNRSTVIAEWKEERDINGKRASRKGHLHMGSANPATVTFYSRVGKRWLDFACSFFGLILLSPVFAVVAIAVKLTSRGSVLFKQIRIGQFGRPFWILKFRSMVAARSDHESLLTAAGDPRITPVGKWLRKTKVDELPQLINVLLGDMSLVGPRPEVPAFVKHYTETQRKVLLVRPGVTGPAANAFVDEEKLLAGRPDKERYYRETILPAKLEIDLKYASNIRFADDLRVILDTFGKLFARVDELYIRPVIGEKNTWSVLRALMDLGALVLAVFVALFIRVYLMASIDGGVSRQALATFLRFFSLLLPFALAELLIIGHFFGIYDRGRRWSLGKKLQRLTGTVMLAATILYGALYGMGLHHMYRGSLLLFWALAWMGMASGRVASGWLRSCYYLEPRKKSERHENDQVLVIGGAGYLGSELVRQLLERGYNVRVLDRLVFGDRSVRELYSNPRFELLRADFRDFGALVDSVRGISSVVHLGGIVGDPACALDPQATLSNNLYATKWILDVCRGFGVRRFVFASTCSVYGTSNGTATETSPTAPVSLYAATKLDSEHAILEAAQDMHCTILRFATIFGLSHRPRFDLVANLLTAQAYFEGKIRVINPNQNRPFIHVRDLAKSCVLALEADARTVSGQVFNVGSDKINHTLGELADIVRNAVPQVQVNVEWNDSDPRDYRVSFEKARRVLGFEAEFGLAAGIDEMLDAFRVGLIHDYKSKEYSNHQHFKQNGFEHIRELPVATNSSRFLATRAAAG